MKATRIWIGSRREHQATRQRFAMLAGYTASYREWGEGNAHTIVLVPALAGGTRLLEPLACQLAKNFRVISYELLGEEDCFALRRKFDLGDLAKDLADFCLQMGLERPFVMGVSFGAIVALEFAIRFPNRLCGLAVQGADVHFKRTLIRVIASEVLSAYPLPADSPFVNQFFNLLFGSRVKDTGLFDFVIREAWRTDQGVMAHRFRLAERLNLRGRLGSVRVPTLIMSGERDLLVSKKGLQELQHGIPHVDYRALAGAGHLAFLSHATEMAGHVQEFVLDTQAVDLEKAL